MYSVDDEDENEWQELGLEPTVKPSDEYDAILKSALSTASGLAMLSDACWEALPALSVMDHVQLYTMRDNVLKPLECGTVIKAQGVLHGRPERLAYAARDCNYETRKKWDTQFREVFQRQTLNKANYVTARVFMPTSPLITIEDRWVGGVLYFDHHKPTDMYRVVFKSATHSLYDAPVGTKLVECLIGLYIQSMGNETCKVSLYVDILQSTAGTWLKTPTKERLYENLRSWMYELENAVVHWDINYTAPKSRTVVE